MARYPLQETALGVIVGTPILAAIFVGLRIYSRLKLNAQLGWDDGCIIAANILSLALIGPSWKWVKMWNVGIHIWEVPRNKMEPDYGDYYGVLMAFHLLNMPILPLVKICMILLLLRIGSVISWLKKVLYAIFIFTVGSALIPWCLFIFICPPRTGNTWTPRTFGNLHCMGRFAMGEMLIWVTCANLLTDLLILPIPFLIVQRWLSGRWRSKLIVIAVFLCGLVVTAIGAAKIYLSYRDRLFARMKIDWTYDINFVVNHIENNVAIILANMPVLRGLVTRWMSSHKSGEPTTVSSGRNHHFLGKLFRVTETPYSKERKSSHGRLSRNHSKESSQKIIPTAREEFDFDLILPPPEDERAFPRTPSPVQTFSSYRHGSPV